jgi:hypothetical protein
VWFSAGGVTGIWQPLIAPAHCGKLNDCENPSTIYIRKHFSCRELNISFQKAIND